MSQLIYVRDPNAGKKCNEHNVANLSERQLFDVTVRSRYYYLGTRSELVSWEDVSLPSYKFVLDLTKSLSRATGANPDPFMLSN